MRLTSPAPGRAEPNAGHPRSRRRGGIDFTHHRREHQRSAVSALVLSPPSNRQSRQRTDAGRRSDRCQSRQRSDSVRRYGRCQSRQRNDPGHRDDRCQSRPWGDSGRRGTPSWVTAGERPCDDDAPANHRPGEPRRIRLCFVYRHPNVRNPATCPNAGKEPSHGVKPYYYRNRWCL